MNRRILTGLTIFSLLLGLGPGLIGPPAAAAPALATTSSQCFYPTADAFVRNQQPGTNFGGAPTLEVSSFEDINTDTRWSYLKFDLSAIPGDAIVVSADLELYVTSSPFGGDGELVAAEDAWNEFTLNWNNRPSVSVFTYDDVSWGGGATGWQTWQADQLVNEWVTNSRVNRGLAIVANGVGTPLSAFHSREGSSTRQPRLCVEWSTSVNTDVVVDDIEVTQAVQDLNNSVRLAAGKRTYVRVHARTTSGDFRTFATLEVNDGVNSATLYPQNPGAHVVLRPNPDREVVDHAFLFQIPTSFTQEGPLVVRADVNPVVSGWRTSRYPPETDDTNNFLTTSVSFEEVPRLGVIMYRGSYTLDDTGTTVTHTTPVTDLYQARSWIKRAFPLSDVWMTVRANNFGEGTLDPDDPGDLIDPSSGSVNNWLKGKRTADLSDDSWYEDYVGDESEIRYYAMLTNSGGFMRGAMGSRVGSGPTGPAANWDPDGIFGDWYAGHEIGHSLGRAHVDGDTGGADGGCGGEEGTDDDYPHNRGYISTDTTGDDALFGFDIGTDFQTYGLIPQDLRTYDARWRDVMTYCAPQWVSDYTYEGVMDHLQDNVTPLGAAATMGAADTEEIDRLMVIGTIDRETGATELMPLFVIPDAQDVEPRTPGAYAIVLRGSGGGELARYPFTPDEMRSGPDNPAGGSTPPVDLLSISELVPHVDGTVQVDVVGPSGLLTTVSAGAAAPSVSVTSPDGGETFSGDVVPVSWTASDADGDDLVFNVQFSADNGATWEMVAQGITENSVAIPRENVASTSQGRFRVWASDGIHTSRDTSGSFTTALRNPQVTLLSPSPGTYVAINQTLNLEALAYSPNVGTPDSSQISWTSSIDGALGDGEELAVTGLTPGVHTITVSVNDGVGTASDSVTDVIVVSDPRFLPTPEKNVAVGPSPLLFWPEEGITSQTVRVDNEGGTNPLTWASVEFTPWLSVGPISGSTPDEVTVSVDATGLDPGLYDAGIAFGSTETSETRFIQVAMSIPAREAGRPCMAQSTFDSSDDGWLVFGDAQGSGAIPDHNDSGGNPGGYISATDDAAGGVWYWDAPGKYLGDQSCAYGKELTFDLTQSATDNPFDADDVALMGETLTLVYDTAKNPGTAWTSYSVTLAEDAGWVKEGTSTPPTQAEMEGVLSTLQALRIRGEYRTGADTGGLDNVNLAARRAIFLPLVLRQ